MQADEIIQQKEWVELNAEEKASLQELAATEQEFNLLKKMLQVSAEENEEVPVVSAHVKDELHAMVVSGKRSHTRYWYAAAAAILLFIAGAIFLPKEKHTDIPLVKTDTPVYDSSPAIAGNNHTVPDTNTFQPQQKKPVDKIFIAKVLPQKKVQQPEVDNTDKNLQVYASVCKTVSDEKELLDLVTEIY
ncbi:hypothetical protein [Ferruginibacter sp. HRS2-29]|uniref:hypothetical protein n=1 Tax=Ferruginibacter sp. HRS2-29 TaxID=2487334 RepID=UPI0020CC85E2|nr:hypothetical protein [Ferruginibacter sp. HRS2-29]MCP9751140.1 hypothetical protein [Ferruginibacter sp. HRS2-29]